MWCRCPLSFNFPANFQTLEIHMAHSFLVVHSADMLIRFLYVNLKVSIGLTGMLKHGNIKKHVLAKTTVYAWYGIQFTVMFWNKDLLKLLNYEYSSCWERKKKLQNQFTFTRSIILTHSIKIYSPVFRLNRHRWMIFSFSLLCSTYCFGLNQKNKINLWFSVCSSFGKEG